MIALGSSWTSADFESDNSEQSQIKTAWNCKPVLLHCGKISNNPTHSNLHKASRLSFGATFKTQSRLFGSQIGPNAMIALGSSWTSFRIWYFYVLLPVSHFFQKNCNTEISRSVYYSTHSTRILVSRDARDGNHPNRKASLALISDSNAKYINFWKTTKMRFNNLTVSLCNITSKFSLPRLGHSDPIGYNPVKPLRVPDMVRFRPWNALTYASTLP